MRRLVRVENVAADTLTRTGVQGAATGDTKRVVRYNVPAIISGDLLRKTVSTAKIIGDVIIVISRSEEISGDLSRRLGVKNGVRADSLRQLKKFAQIHGDTRLAYGLRQNVTADTLRKIDYAVWHVDETGKIQINRPIGRHIQIGDVRTLSVENWRIVPDDRMSCRVTFSAADAEILNLYWCERILVDVVDEGGRIWQALRVKVNQYGYVEHFSRYYWANLEFWKE